MSQNLTQTIVQRAKQAIKQAQLPDLQLAVSEEDHQAELTSLIEIIKHDKFFIVVDSGNGKIVHAHGIEKWLGYNESTFTLGQYFKIIHKSFINPLIHLAQMVTKMANTKDFKVGFRQQQYVISIALQHAKGHYVLCKRSLSAWQWGYDNDKQEITHYINEFTIVNHEVNEISPEIFPRILDQNRSKLLELEEQLHKNLSKYTEDNSKMFSPQELRILRRMAYDSNVTSAQIAMSFKIKPDTMGTFNKRIIKKGRLYFQDETLGSVREIAALLKKNFLV